MLSYLSLSQSHTQHRRWEREMASMPGYELTEPWLTEDGLPKKGVWDVVYYAGEGKLKNGCKPMPKLRRSLLQLVMPAFDKSYVAIAFQSKHIAAISFTRCTNATSPSFLHCNFTIFLAPVAV